MKFKITDSKLKQVIFRFLDNKNYIIKESPESYSFFEDEDSKFSTIRVYMKDDDEVSCLVSIDLVTEIESFFSISYSEVKYVLQKYVESKIHVDITKMWLKRDRKSTRLNSSHRT